MEDQHIGVRIRRWRVRRGLTQDALAGMADIKQPYLSRIENGLVQVDKRSTLTALARGLSVSVGDLVGQPGDPTNPAKSRAAAVVPAIRSTLVYRRAQGARQDPAAVDHGGVADALEAIQRSDYAALAPMLPFLLATASGADLVKTCYAAMYHLRRVGYEDLARDVATLGLDEAQRDGAPTWIGLANYVYAASLPAETADVALLTAARAAEDIQHALADTLTRQAYGMLHLTAALRAASDHRSATARSHLDEAHKQAASLGEPLDHGLCGLTFGPINVLLWKIAILQELGEPDQAIAVADGLDPRRIGQKQRRAAYWRDLGHSLTTTGADDRAIVAFHNAEQLAPQPFRLMPEVRDSIEVLGRRARRRATGKPLARLAAIFTNEYSCQE